MLLCDINTMTMYLVCYNMEQYRQCDPDQCNLVGIQVIVAIVPQVEENVAAPIHTPTNNGA